MTEISKDRIINMDTVSSSTEIDRARIVPLSEEDVMRRKEINDHMEWKNVLITAIRNIPSSALETGKAMVKPVVSLFSEEGRSELKETGKEFGRIGAGLYQKVTPGEQEYEKNVDALVDFFKDRYGNIDNFKKTVAQDPVGVITDVATVFTAGGAALKVAGTASKIQTLSKMGKEVSNIGARLELQNLAKGALAQPLKLIPMSYAEKMYRSAVKFNTTLPDREIRAITRTALDAENQIMPSVSGIAKLRDKIDAFNDQISDLLTTRAGFHRLPVDDLRKGLDGLMDDMMMNSDEPLKIQSAFKAVQKEFDKMEELDPTRSVTQIQKIKTNIYKELDSIYSKHALAPAKAEVRMAVAKNAKLMIEDLFPEIKQLNKKEGALLDLWDALETKSNRIMNRDLVGISAGIKVASGAAGGYAIGGELGSKIGTYIGLAHGIVDNPQIKSKLAIVLSRLKQQGIQTKPTHSAVRLGLVQIGKDGEAEISPD